MADVFRFPDTPPPPPPKCIHRATFFAVVGGSGRPMFCVAYEVETGLELRMEYSAEDVMRSQLFRGIDRDERAADLAAAWRLALLEKGFSEVPL